jgi:hypothetical protein
MELVHQDSAPPAKLPEFITPLHIDALRQVSCAFDILEASHHAFRVRVPGGLRAKKVSRLYRVLS